jgi:hypothetical protein
VSIDVEEQLYRAALDKGAPREGAVVVIPKASLLNAVAARYMAYRQFSLSVP